MRLCGHFVALAAFALLGGFALEAAPPSLRAHFMQSTLPSSLRKIAEPKSLTRAESRTRLGPPASSRETTDFYNLSGIDYDTKVDFDATGRLHAIRYLAPAARFRLPEFRKWISAAQIETARREVAEAPRTHESGRTFKIRLPKEGLELQFVNAEPPWLESVVIWQPGGPSP